MGGDAWATSDLGKGSAFHFTALLGCGQTPTTTGTEGNASTEVENASDAVAPQSGVVCLCGQKEGERFLVFNRS